MLKETCSSHGDSPLSIKDLMSLHMRLFAVNSSGHSVLHIASKNGDWELLHLILQVAKVLEHNPDGADVNILTRRDAGATPIEQAISSCQPICLRLLLEFASETPIINEILNDETLLSQAVVSGELKILEVLLEFGMWKGLSQAIQASMSGSNQRMLQIVNVLLHPDHESSSKHSCETQQRSMHGQGIGQLGRTGVGRSQTPLA